MPAIDNNNPVVVWNSIAGTNPLTIGNELWAVGVQATSWPVGTSVDVQTAPIGTSTYTTVHTFSANGAPYVFRPGPCLLRFHLNGTQPSGKMAAGRIPEPDQSDTFTGSIVGGGTGISAAASVDGGSYTLAGTTDAMGNLNLLVQPFEDTNASIPRGVVAAAIGANGAFQISGLQVPKSSAIQVQAVNTAANVSFTLTKDIGDNRRSKSLTLRTVPNGAGAAFNLDDGLFMFLADTASAWASGTVALETFDGTNWNAAFPPLDNTRAVQVGNVASLGSTVPFRFHPNATITGLVCALAQIPMDVNDDAPFANLTGGTLNVTSDTKGGTYNVTANINTRGLVGQEFSGTGSTNAPGANELFLVKVTSSIAQTLTSVSCVPQATNATAKFKAVIYPDNAGSPAGQSLLGTGAEVVGTTAGTELDSVFATPPSLSAGTSYWIGFITNASVVLAEVDSVGTAGVKAANTYTGGAPATCPAITASQPDWEIWGVTNTGNTDVVINWTPQGSVAGANMTLPIASFLGANSSGGNTGHGDYSASVQVPPGQFYITSSNTNTTAVIGGSKSQGN